MGRSTRFERCPEEWIMEMDPRILGRMMCPGHLGPADPHVVISELPGTPCDVNLGLLGRGGFSEMCVYVRVLPLKKHPDRSAR